MRRNEIRIVLNPFTKHISYYIRNELQQWEVLSSSSPLSRQYYTDSPLENRISEIFEKLDEIYNRKNKGLDILFEGDQDSYKILEDALSKIKNRDITCKLGFTRIIVVGKVGIGKSTLIKAMEEYKNQKFITQKLNGYEMYRDVNNTEWYEVKGIDFGREKIEEANNTIKRLVENTAGIIVYCIEASNRRIEESEKEFLLTLLEKYPNATGMIVLTKCFNKKGIIEFVDEVEKLTKQIKVVITLAKEFETDAKDNEGNTIVIKPFGMDKLAEYIFERR